MKKILWIITIVVIYLSIGKFTADSLVIPKEAIRIRVIANSDSEQDQAVKIAIKEELETYFYQKLKDIQGVETATKVITSSIPEIEEKITSILQSEEFTIHFGLNYFPEKEYKGVQYDSGYYESLVVTLGEGKGKNWWCVLFPPLCLLENETMEEVEYRSLVADILEKYF